jgi:Uma2 family endonuclease
VRLASEPKRFLTIEQYLELEANSLWGERHEYEDGQIFPMGNPDAPIEATVNHAAITANLLRHVGNKLDAAQSPSRAYTQNLIVKAGPRCAYPDLVVVCGKPQTLDDKDQVVLNPLLVAEVLSPGTEDFDRGRKFVDYRSIDSLREYLLVAQSEILIEQWIGGAGKPWQLTAEHRDPLASIALVSVPGIEIPLSDIYENVTWPSD